MRSWSGFGRRRSRKSHVWHKTFGTRRWSLFERLASNDDIGVDIDIVSFASRLRCPYMLFFDVRLSLALNIWLSVNRAQLEGLYKFVIIGSHLALWDSPDKPAQTSYFLSNPLLSFHQPFYTSLSAYEHFCAVAIFEFQLVLPCWWWNDYDDVMVVVMALLQWICGLTRPQICALWRLSVGGSSAKKPQFLSTFFRNVQTINWCFEESAHENSNKNTKSVKVILSLKPKMRLLWTSTHLLAASGHRMQV